MILTENPKVVINNQTNKISAINWTLIVLLSFFLRTFNLKNDIHFHPDERFIMMTVFDFSDKGFNPPNFNYGLMPFYVLYALFKVSVFLGLVPLDFDSVYVVGRVLVAVVFIFQLIFIDKLLKILEASTIIRVIVLWLCAVNPFMVQQYRFFSVDPFLTLFMTSGVYYAIREKPVKLGVSIGLALACKATAVMALAAAGLTFIFLGSKSSLFERTKQFLVAILMAGLAFSLTNPYFILNWTKAIGDTMAEIRLSQGLDIRPYTLQFLGTTSPWYQLEQLSHAMRLEILVTSLVGILLAVKKRAGFAQFVCLCLYILPSLSAFTKFPRYFLPAVPLIFVFAGLSLEYLKTRLRIVLAVVLIGLQAITTISFMLIYLGDHPYLQISKNIKSAFSGITVGNPVWDDTLPIFGEEVGIKYVNLEFYGAEELENFLKLIDTINKADLVIFPTQRIPLSFARAGERGKNVTRLINLIFEDARSVSPAYFVLVQTSFDPPRILGFKYLDYCKDESLTVYQYPRTFVFKRIAKLEAEHLTSEFNRFESRNGRFDFKKYCSFYNEPKRFYPAFSR